jgi:hypothetical protein
MHANKQLEYLGKILKCSPRSMLLRGDRINEILTQILQITNNNKRNKGNEDRKYQ